MPAKTLVVYERLCSPYTEDRDHRSRLQREIRFQCCYQTLAEYSSTTLRFCVREARPCGDQGFQIRDLQVACRFNASHFTHFTLTTQ